MWSIDIQLQTIFEFAVAADSNDNIFSFYSLSLGMKLNIPKCHCSFALLTTVYCLRVTSRSLSLVFLNWTIEYQTC